MVALALVTALTLSVFLFGKQPKRRAEEPLALPEPAPAPPAPAPAEEDAMLLYRGPADELEPTFDPDPFDGLRHTRRSSSRVKVCFEDEADEDETTSPLARILLTARADSDCGKTRRENEDSLLFFPERSLFAVADGVGGYHGGRVASSLAVETLRQAFETESYGGRLDTERPIPRRGHELASAILQTNVAVSEAARATPELSRMGTTLVAARFSPNKQRVYIGHVGDSRCYRLRAGKLRQLTTDQTMRLVGMQGPGADDLLQAIGVTQALSIDLIVDKPRPDDVYLLCSDGLPKMVSDQDIERVIAEQTDLEAAVYALIEMANDAGGVDNVSVILVKVLERSARSASTAGWSTLPEPEPPVEKRHSEVTVIAGLALDEPSLFGPVPASKKLNQG